MEAVRIGEHKLKLSLSVAEAEKYGISGGSDCKDTSIVRRNVWQALDEAKAISGFDPSGDKLLIQFYKLPSGGLEIFVTKLGVLSEASARLVSASKRITLIEKRKTAYLLLNETDEMQSFVNSPKFYKNVNNYLQIPNKNASLQQENSIDQTKEGHISPATFYRDKNGAEYLVLEELGLDSPEPEYLSILEFATRLPDLAADFIEEHFEKIAACGEPLPK